MAAAPRDAGKAKEASKAEAAAPAPKKKSKLPLIAGALVLLLGGGGAAAYFLMKPKLAADGTVEEAKVAAPTKPPVFLPLDTFTVNLRDQGIERYLQTAITLEFEDTEASERLKAQLPVARSRVLLLLSSKEAPELQKVEDKRKLATDIAAELAKVPALKDIKITAVHFSAFVIQ